MAHEPEAKHKTPLTLTPLKSPPIFPHLTVPQPVHGESTRDEFFNFYNTLGQLREPLLFAPYEIPNPYDPETDDYFLCTRCFEHPKLLPCVFHFKHSEDPDCNAEFNYELLRRKSIQSRVSVQVSDTARCADELLRQGYVDDALFLYEKFDSDQQKTGSFSYRRPEDCERYLLQDISDDNRRTEVLVQLWLASKDISILSHSLGDPCHPCLGLLNEANEIMSFGEKAILKAVPPKGIMLYRGSWGFALRPPRGWNPTPARVWTNDSDRAREDAEDAQRAAYAECGVPVVPKIEKVRVERDDLAVLFQRDHGLVAILKPNCRKKPRAFSLE